MTGSAVDVTRQLYHLINMDIGGKQCANNPGGGVGERQPVGCQHLCKHYHQLVYWWLHLAASSIARHRV